MSEVYIINTVKNFFLVVFQEVFALDTDFPYNGNDITQSSILISSKYSNADVENLKPQIIVSTVGYNAGRNSLGLDFYQETPATATSIPSRQHTNTVNFQLSINTLSPVKQEAELVADKIFNILFAKYAREITALNYNLLSFSVGEASPDAQYPQYDYICPVVVTGWFVLNWTITHPNGVLLNKITAALAALSLDVSGNSPSSTNIAYREPCTTVEI
jgi:hypothetical protein